MDRKDFLSILLILLFVIIWFYKLILNPSKILANGDVIGIFYYWMYYFKLSVLNFHSIPLWNNIIYSGTLFIANPLTIIFYPLTWLFLIFRIEFLFGYLAIFNYFLAGLFTYLFMKELKFKRYISLVVSLLYIFSGALSIWGVIIPYITSFMLLPLVLLCIERYFKGKKLIYLILISLLVGFQILGSSPQIFFYSLIMYAFYIIIKLLSVFRVNKKEALKLGSLFILFFVFSSLMAMVQILPTLEFAKESSRQSLSFEESSKHSFSFYNLITFLIPNFFGDPKNDTYWAFWKGSSYSETYVYLGIISIILALIALFYNKDRRIWMFLFLALFAFLFAMGKYSPVYYLFYKFIPGIGSFKSPGRMLPFFTFFFAVLGGFGLNRFLSDSLDKKKILKFFKILFIILNFILLTIILVYLFKSTILKYGVLFVRVLYENFIGSSRLQGILIDDLIDKVPLVYNQIFNGFVLFFFFFGLSLLLLYLKLQNKIKKNYFMFFLVLLIFVELMLFNNHFISVKSPEEAYSDSFVNYIEKEGFFRVLVLRGANYSGELYQSIAVRNNIQKVDGCDTVILNDYYEYVCKMSSCKMVNTECLVIEGILNKSLLNALNVKYILSYKDLNNFKLVKEIKGVYLYENKDYLPRAFVRYDGVIHEADITYYSPNSVKINASGIGTLILLDTYFKGWKVFVDGKEEQLLKIDIFRGVYLDKGEHMIEFVYKPKSFFYGLWTSLLSLSFLIILLIYFKMKRK